MAAKSKTSTGVPTGMVPVLVILGGKTYERVKPADGNGYGDGNC